MIVIFVSQARI